MEDKISVYIIFKSDKVTVENVTAWFNNMTFFEPIKMRGKILTKNRLQKYNSKKFLDGIEKELGAGDTVKLSVEDSENNFSLTKGAYNEDIAWVTFDLSYYIYEQNKTGILKFIDDFMQKYDGIVANACSLQDEFWQDNEDIDYYIIKGRSLENIHTKQNPIFPEDTIVDIEYNPGHSHIVNGIWFGSCWTMWYGAEYFKYIPKDILLRYKHCYENRELDNGIIRIKLYDNIWEYDKPENREKQKAFRKQVGIDEVAHRLMEEVEQNEEYDASIEINSGEFPHGGIRSITYYYDDVGEVIAKSKAVESRTYELDKDGKIVWSEVKKLNN
jgi:hypothetical protein